MPYTHLGLILTILCGMVSCSVLKSQQQHADNNTGQTSEKTVVFGDTIDRIIFGADNITWHETRSTLEEADTSVCLKKLMGLSVTRSHKASGDKVLAFILSDPHWYIQDYAPVKQQFRTNLIFVFSKRHLGRVAMLVSFGTDEVAVSDVYTEKDDLSLPSRPCRACYQMRSPRTLARWLEEKLPDNSYYKEYLKLHS